MFYLIKIKRVSHYKTMLQQKSSYLVRKANFQDNIIQRSSWFSFYGY